jgi:hypothetical protein
MRPPFLTLAAVAAAAVGYEVALTRYFALAHYSEYGYWVISIAMAGFAVSGVALSLWRGKFLAARAAWLRYLPLAALLFGALGFWGCLLNPFNALELQHPVLWSSQLLNIGLFYAALFPFFFSCGLYVGLCFISFDSLVGKLYAFDLAGAGLGALLTVAAMFALPPWLYAPERMGEYKPLSYALRSEGAKVLRSWSNPRGAYHVVDAVSERLDLDLSNNAALLGVPETPATLGLYADGMRLADLPKGGYGKSAWFKAALEAFPYGLKPKNALMIGTRGGFKTAAARERGIAVTALESDPELWRQIPEPGILRRQPLEFLAGSRERFGLIDIASDYAAQDRFALTSEMLRACEAALSEDGVLSVGVGIQELGAYGARLVATLQPLFPADRVVLYRSAWSLRALVFKRPPGPATLKSLARFCDERSFDISYAPGLPKPATVWNALPSLGWDGEAEDALRDEAALAFAGGPMAAARDFDLRPAGFDRPFFFSTLKLSRLGASFEHLGELPRDELGLLVNLAVLGQALLLGLLVMLLPLAFRGLRVPGLGKVALYFSCLGLGYLFFEVMLIEKISPYLQDRAWAFSLVLSVMLVSSGLGSYFARGMGFAFGVVALWSLLAFAFMDKALFMIWPWPVAAQALACALMIAPLGFALGMPFSLGLEALSGARAAAQPWAWSLNGAFSVVASPLAFLLGRTWGYSAVAGAAFLVYFLAWHFFPKQGPA